MTVSQAPGTQYAIGVVKTSRSSLGYLDHLLSAGVQSPNRTILKASPVPGPRNQFILSVDAANISLSSYPRHQLLLHYFILEQKNKGHFPQSDGLEREDVVQWPGYLHELGLVGRYVYRVRKKAAQELPKHATISKPKYLQHSRNSQ